MRIAKYVLINDVTSKYVAIRSICITYIYIYVGWIYAHIKVTLNGRNTSPAHRVFEVYALPV